MSAPKEVFSGDSWKTRSPSLYLALAGGEC